MPTLAGIKMRGSLYTRVVVWVNTTLILGHFYLGMKVLAWYVDLKGVETKISSNTCTLLDQFIL
jgi:heme/copper-type cytochrome/quinol oxidase subunit 3